MVGTEAILNWMWVSFGVYWLFSARRTEKAVTHEASLWRVIRLSILAVTFVLLLSPWLRVGPLAWRFVADTELGRWLGVALAACGIVLCVWARVHLGKYWSDKVVLKADHQLIRSGPYAHLRHPIYSGVLLGIAGTAVAVGEWRGVLAFVVMGSNYAFKAMREERILTRQFGDKYRQYQRHAGFALPRW
jgi:protein-S-isoprenylcysteine O-methyltransferase Ste14